MNIDIGSDVSLTQLRGKPLTLVCEIVEGKSGKPELRAFQPHTLKKVRSFGDTFYRLERQPRIRRV